ncbi:diguanylate cyclase GGDEF domain protein [Asticcacaulis biprosthecium C19]|uniref:Diguanylate cyclase GGDEF domain protein n=1 Tax=Asticcacaulis biprosthecium C19 TaxID=715226 RepID=F4QND7_9CAUL|nr:EAL domain-containing protein [Asticcacaulis biprosthecium]EGF90845.1 diguanylate cyclase GGDEF domain protein [Asticcacaulis biprosthecium C19]
MKTIVNDAASLQDLQEKVKQLSESEARAVHAAYHDFLTGAPNRAAFQRELSQRLNHEAPYSLALIDLDRFKYVNDTYGHAAGDALICDVTDRLRATLPLDAFLARLSGDEFGLILAADDGETAEAACQQVMDACAAGFDVNGNTIQIGASIGLFLGQDSGLRGVTDLMRCADIALFAAKRAGRNRICRFDKSLDDNLRRRRAIEAGLSKAIAGKELELHYQPIIDGNTLNVAGFEALLRWKSAELGQVSPAVFIPIAEESGLIRSIGDWVIRQALNDCCDWPQQYVAINLSARQFNGADMVQILRGHADTAGVPYHRVHIEVTETAFFEDARGAAETLGALQSLGFGIALDDFGTGYSSLFSVKNFPLDVIKIDKCFIDGLGLEPQAAPIISAVIHLARGLGLKVVAEGVETEDQRQALQLLGCSHLQGYLFSKPQSRSHILTWLKARQTAERKSF